jgi:GTP cyclohydrolase I
MSENSEEIVRQLLLMIGEDPNRGGLKETPARVVKAWREWAQGYKIDPKDILKTFEDGAEDCGDELVIVSNIPIVSKCEHHLADIMGTAHIGYIPNGKIVGLSKLARVADLFARRLQVQERLTNQIANAIVECLAPKGVAVTIRASHACMSSRGVKVHGSVTTTAAMRGVLLEKPAARAEFLALCQAAERHGV